MKKIAIITGIAIVLAAAFGLYQYQKPRASFGDAHPHFVLSPDQLVSAFQEDEETANGLYLDRILETSGMVAEIKGDDSGSVSILLETADMMSFILCTMDMRDWDEGGVLAGDSITVRGKCTGWLMDVVLTGCVIVEPE